MKKQKKFLILKKITARKVPQVAAPIIVYSKALRENSFD
jgi:hypothetical protein